MTSETIPEDMMAKARELAAGPIRDCFEEDRHNDPESGPASFELAIIYLTNPGWQRPRSVVLSYSLGGLHMPVRFELNDAEFQVLMTPVNGQGGFQNFFRRLQADIDPATRSIELEDADIGRIVRHITYRPGGFEDRLSDIFG